MGVAATVLDLQAHLLLQSLDDQRVGLEAGLDVLDPDLTGSDPVGVGIEVLGVVGHDPEHALVRRLPYGRATSPSAGADHESRCESRSQGLDDGGP